VPESGRNGRANEDCGRFEFELANQNRNPIDQSPPWWLNNSDTQSTKIKGMTAGIEMESTLTLRAYGRTIAIRGPALALGAARDRLPPSYRIDARLAERTWMVGKHADTAWVALADRDVLSVQSDVISATEAALSDLELWVAEHARRYVFVHAGCAAMNGRAIVLPGRTMSGKSSLTAALVRAGADYYSDEYAVLDPRGLVRPYPRKLAIRPFDGSSPRPVPVEDLGGRAGRGPAEVALVAVLLHDAAFGWQSEPLTRGQAMLRMFDNTVAARSRPRAALSALENATLDARVLAGTRGDADETAALLLDILSS
jgi:hypothetical protein